MEEFDEFYYRRLINTISQKIYNGFDLELIGVLKDFDLYTNKKSIEFLEYLIECKIYVKQKEIPHYLYCINIPSDLDNEHIPLYDLEAFVYKELKYRYNKKIYSEIYKITEYVIEFRMSLPLQNDVIYIISELKGIIDNDDKIAFLKEKLKFYWKPFEDSSSFLLFMNERHDWEGQTWQDEIISELTFDEHFILFYLTCSKHENLEQTDYYKTTFKLWVEHYRKQRLIDFCKTEIEKLQGLPNLPEKGIEIKKITETRDKKIKSDMIFKENYGHLFDYIVTCFSDKQNKAFFSYLYHYFSDNGFLLKNAKSSVTYNSYLVKNNFIDKFSKVIQRIDDNSIEEKRMFVIFKKAHDEFIQIEIEIEGKLKEN